MSRKILLCVAAIFAFNFGGFAQEAEEEAVMILEEKAEVESKVEEVKEAAEEVKEAVTAAEATEKAEVSEEKQEIAEQAAEEAVVKAEEKNEAPAAEEVKKEEAIKETIVKAEEKVEENKAEEAGKEKAVEKAAEKAEQTEKESESEKCFCSWLNPMNWFSSGEKAEKAEEAQAEVKPAGEGAKAEEQKESSQSVVRTALLWLPNIVLNLTDIISMDGGVGSETALEVGVTKYFGFGGAFGEKYFIQKGYDRQYGGGYSSGWDLQLLCLNAEKRYVEDTFGTTKKYYLSRKDLGMADPENHTYKDEVRDFYAFGVKAGWLLILGLEIHPVEIADFLASIFFMDIRGDDLK